YVASRFRQRLDPASGDRVGLEVDSDNRDRAACFPRDADDVWVGGEQHGDPEAQHFVDERTHAIEPSVRESVFDHYILPDHIAAVLQALIESIDVHRLWVRRDVGDPRNFRHPLRLSVQRDGEKSQRRALDEVAPLHYWITS